MLLLTELKTTKDTNGNARGLYLISAVGEYSTHIVDIITKDASGDSQVRGKYPSIIGHITLEVTPKEYREWLAFKKRLAK